MGAARACEDHMAMEEMLKTKRLFLFLVLVFGEDFAEVWNHFVELLYLSKSHFLFSFFHPYLPFM